MSGRLDIERPLRTRAGSTVSEVREWFDGKIAGFIDRFDDEGKHVGAQFFIWSGDGTVLGPDYPRAADLVYEDGFREGEGSDPLQVA